MKRSPMPPRKQPMKRTGIKRGKGLARVGAKSKRERDDWEECKRAVRERSGGWCEAQRVVRYFEHGEHADAFPLHSIANSIACTGGRMDRGVDWHPASDPHHVWPEDRDRGVHDPDRVLDLCRTAHDWAHAHPHAASIIGLMRPEGGLP